MFDTEYGFDYIFDWHLSYPVFSFFSEKTFRKFRCFFVSGFPDFMPFSGVF